MYKKTRIKIILILIIMMAVLLFGTLLMILYSSDRAVFSQSQEMLSIYCDVSLGRAQEGAGSDFSVQQQANPETSVKTAPDVRSDFCSVKYKGEEIIFIDAGREHQFTQEEVTAAAEKVRTGSRTQGRIENYFFRVETEGEITLVAFMNNSLISSSASILIHYTLVFGGIAFVLVVLFAGFISGKLIGPLEENDKKQKQFISDAGHELKTPVSVISTNVELLQRDIGADNTWLENIRYENKKMGTLVQDLLTLSRTEQNPVTMGEVDLSRLVMNEALLFESYAFEKNKTYHYDEIDPEITVNGNESQLGQLVDILLDNAIYHSRGEGNIRIELHKRPGKAVLTVSNDAEEIAGRDREHLFDRFYRTDQARNDENDHYGLGLSIAKTIVERHKGRISVTTEDRRIIFTVILAV